MTWLRRVVPLALGSLLLGCDGPIAPEPIAPGAHALSIAASAEPACYPLSFEAASWLAPPGSKFFVEGTMSGDIEGTFGVNIDFGGIRREGNSVHLTGTIEWTVTGGVLPDPFPLVFTTQYEQLNVLHFDGSLVAWAQNMAANRATSGVRKANLEMHGNYYGTEIAYHSFRGVICP
jgi:hypothetical protein